MLLTPENEWIVQGYEEVTAISLTEKREVYEGDSGTVYLLPTLSGLQLWMDCQEWESAPVERNEFLHLITKYHQAYKGSII